MATVFSRIIAGELPGRFIYRDDTVVAFLSIGPVSWGHTLVVPVEEVDRWTDVEPRLWRHLNEVARLVGRAVVKVTRAPRAGYLIAGFEVPHTHIHVFGAHDMSGYLLNAVHVPDEEMDRARDELRAALRELGAGDHVPD